MLHIDLNFKQAYFLAGMEWAVKQLDIHSTQQLPREGKHCSLQDRPTSLHPQKDALWSGWSRPRGFWKHFAEQKRTIQPPRIHSAYWAILLLFLNDQ